ncbi:MAG: hypothetical protein KF846_07995 [Cyclobacteriaceae bacterium]|nr:hypothetical protein [Cyclobacteriaceae bacterium]
MSRKLIWQDSLLIESDLKNLNNIRERVSRLIEEFRKLDLFPLKGLDDLSQLIERKDQFILERIADELPPQQLGKFKLRKSEAVAMLDLPDFDEIKIHCDKCRDFLNHKTAFNLSNWKLSFNEAGVQIILDARRIFVDDKDGEALAALYEQFVKNTNAINAAGLTHFFHPETRLNRIVSFGSDGSVTGREEVYRAISKIGKSD